jgi:hypothetical protein
MGFAGEETKKEGHSIIRQQREKIGPHTTSRVCIANVPIRAARRI